MKSKKHGNEYSKAEVKEQLTIEQVCALVRCSAPTLYRRIKHNPHGALFPSPYKVAATADRGPRHVNRWEQAEVMAWLLKGNAPKWRENTIEIINRANTLDASACGCVWQDVPRGWDELLPASETAATDCGKTRDGRQGSCCCPGTRRGHRCKRVAMGQKDTLDAKMSEAHDTDREPRSFWENHVLLAVVGGVLAAVMYQVFRG